MDHIEVHFAGIFFLKSAMQYFQAHELITVNVAAWTKPVQDQTSQNSGVDEGGDSVVPLLPSSDGCWRTVFFFQDMASGGLTMLERMALHLCT